MYTEEVRTKSGVPAKYSNQFLPNIKPRNQEQETLKQKLKGLYDWEALKEILAIQEFTNSGKVMPRFSSKETQSDYVLKTREQYNTHPWAVIILGTVGNGKTTMAATLVNTFNEQHEFFYGLQGYYTTQENMIAEYKSEFAIDVLEKYKNCGILVIDEINKNEWTDYNRNFIQKILNWRYENNRRTVIIANLSPDEFKELFDAHIRSRMKEADSIIMVADDMRTKGENR